jgi:hypothetical protein
MLLILKHSAQQHSVSQRTGQELNLITSAIARINIVYAQG